MPDLTPSASITDPAAIATLMLSRGKYFVATKIDHTLKPEEGEVPYFCSYAGAVRDRTPDNKLFLVDIFNAEIEFTTDEDTIIGQRIMSLEDLLKATFYPDFDSMQTNVNENVGFIESVNID